MSLKPAHRYWPVVFVSLCVLGAGTSYAASSSQGGDTEPSLVPVERQGRLRLAKEAMGVTTGPRLAQAPEAPAAAPQSAPAPAGRVQRDPPPTATPAPAQASVPPSQPTTNAAAPEPDLSALRYFASRGDTARLKVEIARLRSLYPDWSPPDDPLAIPRNGDPQLEAMWKLYAEGRYPEIRQAIAERQAADPNWTPPADLLNRLAMAEARNRLVNASNLKQYATVISLGASNPNLLNCSDVDVLWRIAEAFVRTDRPQRGVDAYTYILRQCENPQERVATIQKAAELLPATDLRALLSLEKPLADGQPEFAALRDDLARRFIADANKNNRMDVAPEDVQRLEAVAERDKLASDSLLLGWLFQRRGDLVNAEKWFRASRDKEPSASASQGLALVLIARGLPMEAEDIMYQWRDTSDDSKATYLAAAANLLALNPAPVLAEPVLRRIAVEVIAAKYVPAAQQLGWYAQTLRQPQTAMQWFETALQWKPDDEPSAYGLLIVRQSLNDRGGVLAIQKEWAGRSQRIADAGEKSPPQTPPLAVQTPRQEATKPAASAFTTPDRGAPVAAPQRMTATTTARTATARRSACASRTGTASQRVEDTTLTNGWCLMDLNRPLEAVQAFEAALKSPSAAIREDAAYGQSLAYLRLGLTDNAAVAATKAPQRPARAAELQVSILGNRALSAFQAGRYREALVYLDQRAALKTETTDLMVLRAYAYQELGISAGARQIFEVLAETGNKDALRGVEEIRSMMNDRGG
ncbi:cellulose synthase [Rhizobium sp. SGZ-381]|uniref:tetratricopeptide repeat protein n=1 Tax=Rhizobium sp. SGZ-381 TaxID=3342800 RepID=UPI00366F1A6D